MIALLLCLYCFDSGPGVEARAVIARSVRTSVQYVRDACALTLWDGLANDGMYGHRMGVLSPNCIVCMFSWMKRGSALDALCVLIISRECNA